MSERGPEGQNLPVRKDRKLIQFKHPSQVALAAAVAVAVSGIAGAVMERAFDSTLSRGSDKPNVPPANPNNAPERKSSDPAVPARVMVASKSVPSVTSAVMEGDTPAYRANDGKRVEDGGSRVSEGGNYGRNGGVKGLPEMKRGVGKRSEKVAGVSRDADSRLSFVESARAKLNERGKNLVAFSEYQLRGIVYSAVEEVLNANKFPLRKNESFPAKTFPSKLDEYKVDRLRLDSRIRAAIGQVSGVKKERRDEMNGEARKVLAKDDELNVSDAEFGLVSYADAEFEDAVSAQRAAITVEETEKMKLDQSAYDEGYVDWIDGLNGDGFDDENVARSGGEMSDSEFGALFEEHFAQNGVTPEALEKGMVSDAGAEEGEPKSDDVQMAEA